ncbi:hypothetical protein HK102_012338, partial [Quaeritorhiza haematococci]
DFGKVVFGHAGAIIIPLTVIGSTFGAAQASIFTGARVVYISAKSGHLPSTLSSAAQAQSESKSTPEDREKTLELDKWYRFELPVLLRRREEEEGGAYLTAEDLCNLNEFRPNHETNVAANPDSLVRHETKKAFRLISEWLASTSRSKLSEDSDPNHNWIPFEVAREAIAIISEKLESVGPATASGILPAFTPHIPFLSEASLKSLTIAKRHSLFIYEDFFDLVTAKAQLLEGESDDSHGSSESSYAGTGTGADLNT